MTCVASMSFCTRVSFIAARMASAKCVFMFWSFAGDEGCACQRMRSANALLISLVVCIAPKTVIDSMVAKASAGSTSGVMLVSPTTLMCSFSSAALTASALSDPLRFV